MVKKQIKVKSYVKKDGTRVKTHLRNIEKIQKIINDPLYSKSYDRNDQAELLVLEVFAGDYKTAWENLLRQESNDEFKASFDYMARMNDLPPEIRFKKFVDRWEGTELLEDAFYNDYEYIFGEYVKQMSNSEFKEADEYIRRMYQY